MDAVFLCESTDWQEEVIYVLLPTGTKGLKLSVLWHRLKQPLSVKVFADYKL